MRSAEGKTERRAAAYCTYDKEPDSCEPEVIEKDLIFASLCGMIDPVCPKVKAAIEECRAAGIRPIMITGDHRDTAVAIAKKCGMVSCKLVGLTFQHGTSII